MQTYRFMTGVVFEPLFATLPVTTSGHRGYLGLDVSGTTPLLGGRKVR